MNVCVGCIPPPCVFMRATSFSDTRSNRRLAAIFSAKCLVFSVVSIQLDPSLASLECINGGPSVNGGPTIGQEQGTAGMTPYYRVIPNDNKYF